MERFLLLLNKCWTGWILLLLWLALNQIFWLSLNLLLIDQTANSCWEVVYCCTELFDLGLLLVVVNAGGGGDPEGFGWDDGVVG